VQVGLLACAGDGQSRHLRNRGDGWRNGFHAIFTLLTMIFFISFVEPGNEGDLQVSSPQTFSTSPSTLPPRRGPPPARDLPSWRVESVGEQAQARAHPRGHPHDVENPIHPTAPRAELHREADTDAQCCHHDTDPQGRRRQVDHLDCGHEDERPASWSHAGNGRGTPRRLKADSCS
jgi:hypothetical protein